MRYVLGLSGKLLVKDYNTFTELGYQFATRGGVLVYKTPHKLTEQVLVGIKQHDPDKAEVASGSVDDAKIHALLPQLKEHPKHWQQHRDAYQEVYLLLSQDIERVYGWFDGSTFSPLLDLARAMGLSVVNFADRETLKQVEDFCMKNALQF